MRSAGLLLLVAANAHADPEAGPRVELFVEGDLGSSTELLEDHRGLFRLGPNAVLRTTAETFVDPRNPLSYPGWTAGAHYDVALRWGIHLEVDADLTRLAPEMNGMFDRGTTAKLGVALTRYFQWGVGNLAWISFGISHEMYFGHDMLAGVPQRGTTVGLRIGTTF